MSERAKLSTDEWFTVIMLSDTDFKTGQTGIAVGALTVEYKKLGSGAGWTTYSPAAGDWQELGDGEYALQMGASEFTSAGRWQIHIEEAGSLTYRFSAEVTTFSLEDLYTGANIVNFKLKQLNIVNSSGDAIVATGGGAAGKGMALQGAGTGQGLTSTGGTTGLGAEIAGGSGGMHGLYVKSGGGASGSGIFVESVATDGHGMLVLGAGTSHGLTALGGSTGDGIFARSGAGATGSGIRAESAAINGSGIKAIGKGTDHGMLTTGGATGNGIQTVGGATSGNGMKIDAGTSGDGLVILAKGSNANGISSSGVDFGSGAQFNGGVTGTGIKALGGGTAGNGILAQAQGAGHGLRLVGTGIAQHGLFAEATTDGHGIFAKGFATGDGLNAEGGATNANGIKSIGGGAGHGINTTGGATGNGIRATGGATSGAGIRAFGAGASSPGIHAEGGSSGEGIKAIGQIATGIHAEGGDFGHGIAAIAGLDAHGLYAQGGGSETVGGNGIHALGGLDAEGALFKGNGLGDGFAVESGTAATGSGFRAEAKSTNGHGIETIKTGTGLDLKATDHGNGSWEDSGTNLTQQQVRDSMKLAPTAGAPAAGSVDEHLDDILLDTGTSIPATLATIAGYIDTEVAAIKAKTDNLPTDPASETNVNANETKIDIIDTVLDALVADVGANGAGLTALPWNIAWDVEVESEVTDALIAYDPPTRAEATSDKNEIITEVNANEVKIDIIDTNVDNIESIVSNISNVVRLNSSINSYYINPTIGSIYTKVSFVLKDNSGNLEDPDSNDMGIILVGTVTGILTTARLFKDGVGTALDASALGGSYVKKLERTSTGLYFCFIKTTFADTIENLNFTIGWKEATILLEEYRGSAIIDEHPDEATLANSAANKDIIEDAVWDALAASHVIANSMGEQENRLDDILTDTNELQTDWTNGGRLDLLIDAIKAITDNMVIKKNTAISNYYFVMFDSLGVPKTGIAGTILARLTKDGGAVSTLAGSISEIGTLGLYKIPMSAGDTNFNEGTYIFSDATASTTFNFIKTVP